MSASKPPPDAVEDAVEVQSSDAAHAGKGKLRSGVDASEAAKKRWAKRGEGSGQAEGPDETDAGIVARLRHKAAGGDVAAARELREWLDRPATSPMQGDEWMRLLKRDQRAQIRAWIDQAMQQADPNGEAGDDEQDGRSG